MSLAITSETLPASNPPLIVEAGDSSLEDKHYLLKLPMAWDISITQDTSPTLPTEPISLSGPTESGNNRTWTLNKPRAYSFTIGTITQTSPGDSDPGPDVTMSSDDGWSDDIAMRSLDFKLPKPWAFSVIAGTTTIPTTDSSGLIEETSDLDTHYITFHPIAAWEVIANETIAEVNPSEPPSVTVGYKGSTTQQHSVPEEGDF